MDKMKWMFASDLHGSLYYTKKLISLFEQEKADRLVLLGDYMYHGPRNPLPKDYAPKEVATLLNTLKECIIAVRGNCDSEVDQMLLDFPIMQDHQYLFIDGRTFFVTHGHHYHEDALPPLKTGDVFIYGHLHLPILKQEHGIYILNPNSISLPKEGSSGYAIYEEGMLYLKDIEGNILKSQVLE